MAEEVVGQVQSSVWEIGRLDGPRQEATAGLAEVLELAEGEELAVVEK